MILIEEISTESIFLVAVRKYDLAVKTKDDKFIYTVALTVINVMLFFNASEITMEENV